MENNKITLRAARVNSGLSLEEAARELKVTSQTLSSWENGSTFPKVNMLPKFEKVYSVKYDNIKFF